MPKADILSLTRAELGAEMKAAGFPAYRAGQLYSWLYKQGVTDLAKMTNIPRAMRAYLEEARLTSPVSLARESRSKLDETVKFLIALRDGKKVETVLMRERGKATVCVSTQVGCALGCAFCATGRMGLERNLTAGEIVGQVLTAGAALEGPITKARLNLVFMGMGEPLANCPSLFKAIRILNDPNGVAVGARRMTVSTAGLPHGIRRLASLGMQVGLAISLNAATDKLRSKLMPINEKYPIRKVIKAAKSYADSTGRRVTLEYVMLGGVNDRMKDADALASIAADLPCKINIIEHNSCRGSDFRPPTPGALARFVEYLYDKAPAVTVRKSKGADIDAACGQLATAAAKKAAARSAGSPKRPAQKARRR
jgi:23S rRNA (adenine2503-C2)-methyltransferase